MDSQYREKRIERIGSTVFRAEKIVMEKGCPEYKGTKVLIGS